MSVTETHDTAAIGIGLQPPLSPPAANGAGERTATDALGGLPTPPPAIRPPDAARFERAPAGEPLLAPVPAEPRREDGLPSIAPADEELPSMAPPEQEPPAAAAAPVDHFAGDPLVELEPVQPAEIASAELPLIAPTKTAAAAGVRLVVRLQGGDRVDVGEFDDRETATEGAREVIDQVTSGTWPFYGRRFLRPEAVVSVDVVENS